MLVFIQFSDDHDAAITSGRLFYRRFSFCTGLVLCTARLGLKAAALAWLEPAPAL